MNLFIVWLISCFFCGPMACHVASHKKAGNVGFFFGLLLGPFGVIASGFLDNRSQCPCCGGRLNNRTPDGYPLCQHCGSELDWTLGRPLTLQMVKSLREQNESDRKRRERYEADRERREGYESEVNGPIFDEWGNPLDGADIETTADAAS